jgi:hypothetical protein
MEAKLKAEQEAKLEAKQEAELEAKQEAELEAKQKAKLEAEQAKHDLHSEECPQCFKDGWCDYSMCDFFYARGYCGHCSPA